MRMLALLGVPIGLAVSRPRFDKLRSVRPRVFGLTMPQLTPVLFSADRWRDGEVAEVTLSYGQVLDVTAPLVEVITYMDSADAGLPSLPAEVAHRERRDAAILRGDWEEMAGSVEGVDEAVAALGMAVSYKDLDVSVNDERQTVPVTCYQHYQAIQFHHESLTVHVVSRYPLWDLPRFEIVPDLEPYFRGYRSFMLSLLRFW
jgi:hypothetical protein